MLEASLANYRSRRDVRRSRIMFLFMSLNEFFLGERRPRTFPQLRARAEEHTEGRDVVGARESSLAFKNEADARAKILRTHDRV